MGHSGVIWTSEIQVNVLFLPSGVFTEKENIGTLELKHCLDEQKMNATSATNKKCLVSPC